MDWAAPVWRSRIQSGAIATSLAGGATVAERIAHDHRAGRPPHCTISVLPLSGSGLTELGQDPHNLSPDTLETVEHLHSGGFATTRDQAKRVSITEESRVLDVVCGIGGPARYLAHRFGCRVDGIDLTPELIETGRVLTERCKLGDRVALQVGNALELPYPDQTFDVVWCQNVTMNIADKVGLLASVYRVLKRGGLYTATEYSVGPGGEVALLLISLACLSSTNGVLT
jgi:SAM-dependent methyltransferase